MGILDAPQRTAASLAADAAFTGAYGPIAARTRSVTAAATAALDDIVAADTTGGSFAITAPTPTSGRRWGARWAAGSQAPTFSGTFDAPPIFNGPGQTMQFYSDGTMWIRAQRPDLVFTVADYGAALNASQVTDASIATSNSVAVVTSASANFKASCVGQVAICADGTRTTIASWQSATQITLAANAANGSAQGFAWGTDDTVAINNAIIAASRTGQKAVVKLAAGSSIITQINLYNPTVDLEGPGNLIGGKVTVGKTSHQYMNSRIYNVGFLNPALVAGTVAIELMSIEKFDITSCHVENVDTAISVPAFVAVSTWTNQQTCRVGIRSNRLWQVNTALKARIDAGSSWLSFADVQFADNYLYTLVNALDIASIDGLHVVNNTFFKSSYSAQSAIKANHLLVGHSNWVIIKGNNFFESGTESINLTDPYNFTIDGNQFAFCGQRVPSDLIKITLSSGVNAAGTVNNNSANDFTGNYVGIYGQGSASRIFLGAGNAWLMDATNSYYYGGTAIPASSYRYYGATTLSGQPFMDGAVLGSNRIAVDNRNGINYESQRRIGGYTQLASQSFTRTVTASTAFTVGTMTPMSGSGYGGLLHVYVLSNTDSTQTASYLLHVGSAGSGVGRTVTTIASAGATAGSSANQPAFTFAAGSSDALAATPQGSTAGSFQFYIAALGSVHF